MPSSKRRETPPMVRNCVDSVARKLAEKHKGPVTREDVSRAFAICISAGRKSGQLTQDGPLRHTKRGAALAKGHKAKATPERVERYEEMLGSVRKPRSKKNPPRQRATYSLDDLVERTVKRLAHQKINDIDKARSIAKAAYSAESPLAFIASSTQNIARDIHRNKLAAARKSERLSKRQIESSAARAADENARRLVRDVALQVLSSHPRQATNIEAFVRVHLHAAYGDQGDATREYAKENRVKINTAEQRVHRGAQAVMKYGGNETVNAWVSSRRGAKRPDIKANPSSSRHQTDAAASARKSILRKVREAVRTYTDVIRNACQSGDPRRYSDEQSVSLERILYEAERGMIAYCDSIDG